MWTTLFATLVVVSVVTLFVLRRLFSRNSVALRNVESVSTVSKRQTVAVIGAGIAGCAAAWALKRSGFENVVVFEKEVT
jgi:NADPH-dependent 2,4-dienoyl-CoA reductase/sulfur reductase-like enzyme